MIVLVRAVTYAALFVGLVLVFLPARVLFWSGITRTATISVPQIAGIVVGAAGAALPLGWVLPFAPPRRGPPPAANVGGRVRSLLSAGAPVVAQTVNGADLARMGVSPSRRAV